MEHNLQVIKFITSEEVFGDVQYESDGKVSIHNPVQFAATPLDNDQVQLQLAGFVRYGNPKVITVSADHILFVCDPIPELVDAWQRAFSDIIVPEKPGIIV